MKKFAVVSAALLLFLSLALTAYADETPAADAAAGAIPAVSVSAADAVTGDGLIMSTEFPSKAATAGDTLDYALDFENSGKACVTDLVISELPEGWAADFLGDGDSVGSVYLKSGNTTNALTLRVSIPQDAATGMYEVAATAASANGSSTLRLKLGIAEQTVGSSGLVIEYGDQEGSTASTFSFSTTVQNNTSEEQTYSLNATVKNGWTAAITADGTQVSAVTVPARSSQNLIVKITPAADTAAGEYTIPFHAVSSSEDLSGEFSLTITGSYTMTLSTPSGRLSFDATANKASAVTLSLTNTGNVPLQNINLTSSAPTGWTVEYSESTVEMLDAGATKEITAYVTPAGDALSGDYVTLLAAQNSDTSANASFRVTVKTETKWGIIGALIIVVVLAGLGFCFKKFGRR